MIKVNILNLSPEGKILEGFENPEFLDIENTEFIKVNNKIEYSLKISLVNNGVLVKGTAKTELICKCGICLREYVFKLKNSEICHFYEKPDRNEIDLTDDIREDILISFPVNLKCSENCKGLCPICGQNLNEKQCSCHSSHENNDLWSELDKFNL